MERFGSLLLDAILNDGLAIMLAITAVYGMCLALVALWHTGNPFWHPVEGTTEGELAAHGWRYVRLETIQRHKPMAQGWFYQAPNGAVWRQSMSGFWHRTSITL